MVLCPICYDDVPIAKTVLCQHGHRMCEKHYSQRAKAMYESHTCAFTDGHVQRCFVCRTDLPDYRFSEGYFTTLHITLMYGMSKMHGISVCHELPFPLVNSYLEKGKFRTRQKRATQAAAQKTLRLFYSTKIRGRSLS